MFGLTPAIELSSYRLVNFQGLVLGCIEADVSRKYSLEALDEIYQIYMRPLGEKNRN